MEPAPALPTESSIQSSNGHGTLSDTSDKDALEQARKQLEAERLAMAEEHRLFTQRMQAETELRFKEMAKKMEEDTAAVIEKERRMSVAMSARLEEEKTARENVARQLEEERKNRSKLLEEAERQKQELSEQARQQMMAVAERLQEKLQEEATKKLEALASKITADALQKAEQELRKKDDHLMKQLDRERLLRSRLDALEEEKKSLARTFERKFASLETELKSAKALSTSQKSPASTSEMTPAPGTNVDVETLEAFKSWNSKWKSNRALTKQLTTSLHDMKSTHDTKDGGNAKETELDPFIASESSLRLGEDQPLFLITPRSDGVQCDTTIENDETDDNTDDDDVLNEGDEEDDDKYGSGAGSGNLDLEKKQWLDDDWSEEEDWESDRGFSDSEEEEGEENNDAQQNAAAGISRVDISPSKDEWSQFSSMNLSKYS